MSIDLLSLTPDAAQRALADWLAERPEQSRPALAEVIGRHYAAALDCAPSLAVRARMREIESGLDSLSTNEREVQKPTDGAATPPGSGRK